MKFVKWLLGLMLLLILIPAGISAEGVASQPTNSQAQPIGTPPASGSRGGLNIKRIKPPVMPHLPQFNSDDVAVALQAEIAAAPQASTSACQDAIEVTSSADSGAGTLRQALLDVCGSGTVRFASDLSAGGTFAINLTTGQLVVDKHVSVYGEGKVGLSGGAISRVFLIMPGASLQLDGVAIFGSSSSLAGGGVAVMQGGELLTRNGTYFSQNSSAQAGGALVVLPGGVADLQGTVFNANRASTEGGAIASAGVLTMTGVTLHRNSGADGGGLFTAGNATMIDTVVSGNIAGNRGGGLLTLGVTSMKNVSVLNNAATIGAGVYARPPMPPMLSMSAVDVMADYDPCAMPLPFPTTTIADSIIQDNKADFSGGGVSNNGFMRVCRAEIRGNIASSAGGGVENAAGNLALFNSKIVANLAWRYAGILNDTGGTALTDSIVAENVASDGVGGVGSYDGGIHIANSAIVNNHAALVSNLYHYGATQGVPASMQLWDVTISGGVATSNDVGAVTINGGGAVTLTNVTVTANNETGINYWAEEGLTPATVAIVNSIVAQNAPGDFSTATTSPTDGSPSASDASFVLAASGYNLFGIADNVAGLDDTTDQYGNPDTPLLPELDALRIDRDTYVHPLLPTSPAIDKGVPACLPFDQRRVYRQAACDIGAFEFDHNRYYLQLPTRRDAASYLLADLYPFNMSMDAVAHVYAATLTTVELASPAQAGDPATVRASTVQTISVGAEAKFLYVAAEPWFVDEVHLAIGRDLNGNGAPDPEEELCYSADAFAMAQVCSLPKAMLTPGVYWIAVTAPGAQWDIADLTTSDGTTPIDYATVQAPSVVPLMSPFAMRLLWQTPMMPGETLAGVLELTDRTSGMAVLNPIGFHLRRWDNDVIKEAALDDGELVAPGDIFTNTIAVWPEPAARVEGRANYILTDTLPAGVSYVAGSATVTPTHVSGNSLVWALDVNDVDEWIEIAYQVQVHPETRGVLTNTVVATLPMPGTQATESSAAVEVADVILQIGVEAPTEVKEGPITYTFNIMNEGVSTSDPLQVVTVVPANTQHLQGGMVQNGFVIWQMPGLAAGATTQVQMVVQPVALATVQSTQVRTAPMESTTPDIVGGRPAEPGDWPWQVALISKESGEHICGGTLITPDLVLTSVHCVVGLPGMRVADYMAVWVGVVDLTDRNQGQVIDVAHVVMHPDYDPDTAENNVALLRLAAPAQLSATVQPVRLATATDLDLYRPGTLGAVTGWGSTDSYFGPKVDVLHGASVSIVDQNVCDAVYAELLDVPDVVGVPDAIFDSEICAGLPEGGKGPCKGDGGSPLVVPDGHGGWVQVGIASWGGISEDFSCAPAGIPAVFTRVPGIVDWLMGPAQFTYHGPEVFSVSDGSGRPGRSASGYGSHVSTIVGQLEQVIEVFLPAVLK